MHNLFFNLWIKKNLLSKKDLKVLEDRINSFDVGTGIGRLLHKIASDYGGYTASQWKNWILIYSMFFSERSFTRNSFKMLADVCSCLPVSLYSSSVQDRHYKS